jgi:arylformamidase
VFAKLTRRTSMALVLALGFGGVAFAAPHQQESYGNDGKQKLDVYQQQGLSGAPVLVYVHGGAWTRGDKDAVNDLPDFAKRNGFLLISVGYRLTPEADAGGQAEDLASAIAWVKSNAARYGGDPAKLFLMGHSAGAHLVALVGVEPAYLTQHGLAPKDISGVICLDGAGYNAPQEMKWFDARGGPVAKMFHAAFDKNPQGLSPTLVVKTGVEMPPFLILFITSRPDSPPQARALGGAIRRSGGRAVVRATSDTSHAEINKSFGKPGDPEGQIGAAFIKSGALPGPAATEAN